MNKARFFFRVAYLGTHFHGWQTQKRGERTVQQVLAESFSRISGTLLSVTGSGRTDAGVHSEGQTAHVDLPPDLSTESLVRSLNSMLPWDVKIRDLKRVSDSAHARKDAVRKTYRYQVFTGETLSPFHYLTWQPVRFDPDPESLKKCLRLIGGEHDFAAFSTHSHLYHTTVRTLYGAELKVEGPFMIMTFTGNGFMRHMVRRIVGSMLEVARGKQPIDWFERLLLEAPPSEAGPTAPSRGLFLESVSYLPSCYNPSNEGRQYRHQEGREE